MKSIDVKGKPYVEVNERLKYFRNTPKYDGYTLTTDIISIENGVCTLMGIIRDKQDRIVATGLAQEKENSSFINKTSYIENCETSAWGRALGNLGIGIDTSIASAEEILNAMQNQTPKPPKKSAADEIFDPDIDIITGLTGVADIKNLEIYYRENKDKVKDVKAFNVAVNRRKEVILEEKKK